MVHRLVAAPAPEGFREVRSWPFGALDELAVIRGDLGAVLPDGPCRSLEDVPECVLLVASELATNAVMHGRAPALVRLSARAGELLLEVVDRAPDITPEPVGDGPGSAGGFGLMLAERLAEDVGWYCTASGKHIWARFCVPADQATPVEPAVLAG